MSAATAVSVDENVLVLVHPQMALFKVPKSVYEKKRAAIEKHHGELKMYRKDWTDASQQLERVFIGAGAEWKQYELFNYHKSPTVGPFESFVAVAFTG
jgi:hypothetical protein